MKKIFTFEIFQWVWVEVEAESKDEALALIPKPSNEGFIGWGYVVIDEEITLRSEREKKEEGEK